MLERKQNGSVRAKVRALAFGECTPDNKAAVRAFLEVQKKGVGGGGGGGGGRRRRRRERIKKGKGKGCNQHLALKKE